MSTPAVYRFLPFTRRGLVAELRDSAAAVDGPLPFRAAVKLDVTLTGGLGTHGTSTPVAGPGDVVGLDPRAIVRTSPGRDATNVEPNYLVAVDFDDPDLPWALTPAAANPQGRLRPWLALVVVEDRPGVTISVPAGAPLPQLRIEDGAAGELGELGGSWAWAHTQLLAEEGSGSQAAGALQSDPDRHVSRLLCPRRLRPGARWFACLVPAFDAGVARGLGRTPPEAPLGPAWAGEDAVTLPCYYHWEFSTGPAGDFESLARRLQPFVVGDGGDGTPSVGTVKLHIGAAGGPVDLPNGAPGRIVEMDGALRAVQQRDGRLEEVPAALATALGKLLDDIADPSGSDPDDGAVGPPLYGSWAANRFRVGDATGWFRELNLDPRTRVAAGLGAEVVRREQEDLMTACWEQVGSVLEANALLSRASLSISASTRLHLRSIARMGPAGTLTFGAPLAGRAAFGDATVRAAITPTSLPDTTVDPALRRLLAPTSRFVRKAVAVRTGATSGAARIDAAAVGGRFVGKLAAGSMAVDPTDFVPAPLRPPDGAPPLPPPAQRLALKGDLRSVGIITSVHVDIVRRNGGVLLAAGRGVEGGVDPLLRLREAAAAQVAPSAGFALGASAAGDGLIVQPIDRNARGDLVLRTDAAHPNQVVLRVEGTVRGGLLDGGLELPDGIARSGEEPPIVRPGPVAGRVLVERPVAPLRPRVPNGEGPVIDRPPIDRPPIDRPPIDRPPIFEGPVVTMPPLVRDALVLNRFEAAIGRVEEVSALADAPPARALVPFALTAAAQSLAARCAPASAHTARVATMVTFGDTSLADLRAGARLDALSVAPQFDRIMAYPEVATPAYRLLARYDRTRLLPGVDAIPPDSVTLLETNPRFVGAFLAGVNHELNRELLWRRYPTDQRGTPMRRFWDRIGAGVEPAVDVAPMHQWVPAARSLVDVAGGAANLVLLIRGELFRRYPNTVVVAVPATGPATPSTDDAAVERPIFAGLLEPDVSFFGFDLVEADLTRGNGWFFALQEQLTEPRFGLDETVDPTRPAGPPRQWRAVAWPDTELAAGAPFTVEELRRFATDQGLQPSPATSAAVAEALFQNPVQVLVHARHLVATAER